MSAEPIQDRGCACSGGAGISRRDFLFAGALALSSIPLAALGAAAGFAPGTVLLKAAYARQRIARMSQLVTGTPLYFDYPRPDLPNLLVKLGAAAGGGLGPGRDIVAFNLRCTHMGGDLSRAFQPAYQLLGPCPRHLTSFDLTRHGLVITGSATESLPQIELELDGDTLYAVGVMGLAYGETGTAGSA